MNKKSISRLIRNLAQSSDYKHKHAAILTKGGQVINTSVNKRTYNSLANRFNPVSEHASLHAEIGCILGISRKVLNKGTLYVGRIDAQGKLVMSKPCEMCEAALKHVGIKKIYFTDVDGKWRQL